MLDQDKHLYFYKLMHVSGKMFIMKSKNMTVPASNLIMIQISDLLVGFYKLGNVKEKLPGILSYIAGYLLLKIAAFRNKTVFAKTAFGARIGLGNKTCACERLPFHWTEAHDISLCCELRNIEPYQYKSGTRESGSAWEQIAKNLNSLETPQFSINKKVSSR